MKKVLSIIIIMLMVSGFCAGFSVVAAGDFVVDGTVLVEYVGNDEHVVIPDGITEVGEGAFYANYSLKSISIPSSVTTIGNLAFLSCSSLSSVNIPNTVTEIGDGAFSYCTSLTGINVSADNANYSSVGGVLFNKDETELVNYPAGKTASAYAIPNGVKVIGFGAFAGCTSIESVSMPSSVATIGDSTFNGCYALEAVNIPSGVKVIGDGTFAHCVSLMSVYIPISVEEIGSYAFGFSDVTTFTVIKGSYAHEWAIQNKQPFVLSTAFSFENIYDVLEFLKLIANEKTFSTEQIDFADFVRDGKLNSADALAILKTVVA